MAPQKKILIIGKEEKDRHYLSSFLSRMSFSTEEAISLNEASNKLISNNHYSMTIVLFSPVGNHTDFKYSKLRSIHILIGKRYH